MGSSIIAGVIQIKSPLILVDYLDACLPESFELDRKYGIVNSKGELIQLPDGFGIYPKGSMVKIAFQRHFDSVKNSKAEFEKADGNYWQIPTGYRIAAVPGRLFPNVPSGVREIVLEPDYQVDVIAEEATAYKLKGVIDAFLFARELFTPHEALGNPSDPDVLNGVELPNVILPQK